jgi:hypothetical protein
MSIRILENSISKKDLQNIRDMFYSNAFAWYLQLGVNTLNDGYTQFCHTFYNNFNENSPNFLILKPIIDLLNPLSIIRVKANLLIKTNKNIKHGLHIDQDFKCTTAIFYLNTNNGFTEFEDGTKIFSEENKLVIFDNFLKHTGSSCTDKNERIIINFNYVEKIKKNERINNK